ncbi:MAG TPA: PH domain-containing protein [Bryobacteraceae bacterium]|nr:PH domain-containing protein [Bryobacteraceae bacterium]
MHLVVAAPLIGAVGVGIAIMALTFALFYAPGPPRYTLTQDALTIHDRFYPVTLPAEAVDVGSIQVVDFTANPEWRPVRRTNGFSSMHYHSGWYRVAGGQKIRLYRADGKKLVLLPPRGTGSAVIFEAPEPERFIADLKRAWNES